MIFTKKITSLAILLTVATPLVACDMETTKEKERVDVSKMTQLTDDVYVDLTDNWESGGAVLGIDTWKINDEASFNVVSEYIGDYSHDEYIEITTYNLQQAYSLEKDEIEVSKESFNGFKTSVLDYSMNPFGTETYLQQYVICEDNNGYVFTVSSQDEISQDVIDEVHEVLDTLVIQEEADEE